MMEVVPAAAPAATPAAVMVAMALLPLLQVPPAEVSASAVVMPMHILVLPVTGPGKGFTVTERRAIQPVGGA